MRTGTIESDCEALLKNKEKQKRMKSKQSCPRGQGLPNLKTEASSPRLARKRYFDAPYDSLIRLTCYSSLNRWGRGADPPFFGKRAEERNNGGVVGAGTLYKVIGQIGQ